MNRLTEEERSVLNTLTGIFVVISVTIVIGLLLMFVVKLGWAKPGLAQAEDQATARVFLPGMVGSAE